MFTSSCSPCSSTQTKGRIRQNVETWESSESWISMKPVIGSTLLLVIKPNGKLRVCLDPRTLNSVLWHNIHNAKRFVDIISKVKGFKYVSKIDADSGFWTLPLDRSSQLLTTFDTLWGQFWFMKLPFGLCESHYFLQVLYGLRFLADDVLIVSSDQGPVDEHDHDRCLLKVLNWCREVVLKLNAAKCIFKAK